MIVNVISNKNIWRREMKATTAYVYAGGISLCIHYDKVKKALVISESKVRELRITGQAANSFLLRSRKS